MIYKSYIVEQDVNTVKENLGLFYGENLGLKNDFKKKIIIANNKCQILRFSNEEILKNKNNILKEISNISLFGNKKIIFIDQANEKILELIGEIQENINEDRIFLFADALEKRSKLRSYFEKTKNCASIPCYEDNAVTIKKIIQDELKGFTGLTPNNINLILENTNLNRAKLNNELSKIACFFLDKKIDEKKLEELLNTKENEDFNKLKDEALIGNKIKTNKLLSETLIDTDKNIYYLNLINQRLNKIREVNDMNANNLEVAISNLKPPIFWKDKQNFILQAKKWSQSKIGLMLKKTYELEKDIKSNSVLEKNILIKKLMIDICVLANF